MITGITLENFKAFKGCQRIPIRPLTLIFGPNSAGKSTIFHALAFLRHAYLNNGHAEVDRVDLGWTEVRLGGWQNLVHGHDPNASFSLGLAFEADARWSEGAERWEVVWEFGRFPGTKTAWALRCEGTKNGVREFTGTRNHDERDSWLLDLNEASDLKAEFAGKLANKLEARLQGWDKSDFKQAMERVLGPWKVGGLFPGSLQLEQRRVSDDSFYFSTRPPSREELIDDATDEGDIPFARHPLSEAWKELLPSRTVTPEQVKMISVLWQEWVGAGWPFDRAARTFERILNQHTHLDPVRERPKNRLSLRDLGASPVNRPWVKLLQDTHLQKSASDVLEMLTDPPIKLITRQSIVSTRRISTGDEPIIPEIESYDEELAFENRAGVSMSHHDLGYGISAVLPIILALETSNGLTSIEQPELHIHPKLQTELGDLLIQRALKSASFADPMEPPRPTMPVLVETHSEHLILRLLRRIRETTRGKLSEGCVPITPNEIAVLYVEPGEEGATIRELRVNDQGRFIDSWPNGFFEERFNEEF